MCGLMMTRAEEAPSRARRSALALAARALTALMPAPGDGHTHEEHSHAKPVDEAERCNYAIKHSPPGLRRYRGGSG